MVPGSLYCLNLSRCLFSPFLGNELFISISMFVFFTNEYNVMGQFVSDKLEISGESALMKRALRFIIFLLQSVTPNFY